MQPEDSLGKHSGLSSDRNYRSVTASPRLASLYQAYSKHHGSIFDLPITLVQDTPLRDILPPIRRCKNSLLPISKLPLETLVMIFKYIAQGYPPGTGFVYVKYGRKKGFYSRLCWIHVTHVCHQWRQAALEHPELWGLVPFNLGRKWTREMLTRAKAAPLIVKLDELCRRSTFRELTKAHIPRMASIDIDINGNFIYALARALATTPTPILEVLQLSGPGWNGYTLNLLAAPRLRQLYLQGIWFPWTLTPMANLTSVQIYFYAENRLFAERPAPIPGCENLMAFLEQAPGLEILNLAHCIPSRSVDTRVVGLPHLKTLGLGGSTPDVVNLVTHLDVPSSAKVFVACHCYDANGEECLAAIPMIRTRVNETTAHPSSIRKLTVGAYAQGARKSLTVAACSSCVWDLEGYRDLDSGRGSPVFRDEYGLFFERDQYQIAFEIHWANPELREVGPIARQLCQRLPLKDLQTLCHVVGSNQGWTTQDWIDTFRPCREVQSLEMLNVETNLLAQAFRRTECESAGNNVTTDGLLFPKLGTLQLNSPNLRRPAGSPPEIFDEDGVFLGCLRTRKERDVAVRNLELVDCQIDHERVDTYREVVENLKFVVSGRVQQEEEDISDVESLVSIYRAPSN
ncbi:hypothetical protein BV25DRAFT_1995566 [Artomyces pyxidatus]|uniref:Uncharacterized protein n=1 Tax=Artomyces pyxidatus TaxID=48021 RepID=A0ACB8SL47_9AGAM|nr:hypothetical protein BV25DRAFT_1995566 [Artomyces pyxidatus]